MKRLSRLIKSIFRPIDLNDPWKCLWSAVQILAVSMLLLACIFLIPVISVIIRDPVPAPVSIAPFYSAEEYNRLHDKHGRRHVIINELGQVPYYYDAQGRKCKLM